MKRLLLFVFLTLQASIASAQNLQPEFETFFAKLEQDTLFNGNILIAHKGKVVYQKSIGYADFATQRKLNENSIFELASVSKQFTAMGIMILEKEGKLRFEDSLRKFIPELPYNRITIRHLLNHTSGLPDYMKHMMGVWDNSKIATNEDMIEFLAKKRPSVEFSPGEKYEYSNTGYALLASIIERVSGKSFGEYVAAKIFKPLGMNNTFVYTRRYKPKTVPNYAYGFVLDRAKETRRYVLPDSTLDNNYVYQFDGIVGDGTVNSTAGDMLKWDRALRTTKLVSQRSLDQAVTKGRLNNGDSTTYGFGWQISYDSVLGPRYSHSGGWPGYATFIARYPKSDWTVIVLRNADAPVGLSFVLNDLNRVIKGRPALYTQPAITISEEAAKPFVGSYKLRDGFVLRFSITNGKFYIQGTGQSPDELFPTSTTQFFSRRVGAEIEFVMGESGKADKLILTQGAVMVCPRVE
jgi:CubicO group peptidase (beta-lactamase class C family)